MFLKKIYNHRFLISRRFIQFLLLTLFIGSHYAGWSFLNGNFSAAMLLDKIPLADPYSVLQILVSGYLLSSNALVGAFIVFSFYALAGGRLFCSWVCPFNLLSDFAAWTHRKYIKKQSNYFLVSRNSRYFVLFLGLSISFILGFAAFEMVNPISILHRAIIFGIGGAWSIIIVMFLFEIAVLKNGWCGHFCPVGAFYALIGRFGLLKVSHNVTNCTKCNQCFAVCPEKQVLNIVTIKSGMINSGECTNCGRCIEVCADHALKFQMIKIENDQRGKK